MYHDFFASELARVSVRFAMEVIAAAGLCAPGCGAVVSALAGGPVLSAVSMAAAVGYGIYTLASGKGSEAEGAFEDAIEGEADELPPPVVKVARQDGTSLRAEQPDSSSFL